MSEDTKSTDAGLVGPYVEGEGSQQRAAKLSAVLSEETIQNCNLFADEMPMFAKPSQYGLLAEMVGHTISALAESTMFLLLAKM